MDGIFLCLLCFSGFSVSSCLSRQYLYVADPLTWTEAQTYCRQKYTDLATVESNNEMDQLKSLVAASDQSNSYIWIGLYNKIQWKWSDGNSGSGSDYRNWQMTKEPDFSRSAQFCVQTSDDGRWWDEYCSYRWSSVCYRGTQQDPDFVFVSEQMSWSDAQRHCRENYVDLATVRNDTENKKILDFVQKEDYPWIGLYRDPDMFWSDGSGYSFQFWGWGSNPLGSRSVVCAAVDLSDSGKWRPKPCEDRYPFVCYSTGSKHVIKLRMKPDEPSADLNDPVVKADILGELKDRLKESGLNGVTLRWREQPDGQVFHKEGGSSPEKKRKKCDTKL